MPLVAHNDLPSFARLALNGQEVLSGERARQQQIRELHVGILNIMPDAALEATERQFLRLIGSSNCIAQFYVHPFTVEGVGRQGKALEHIGKYYLTFDEVREQGLDALIISGANPANPDLTAEGFWNGLVEVMQWARVEVCSTYYSCLATHAALQQFHGIERVALPQKRWGVYSHRVTSFDHPLLFNVNTRFDGPHSHVYDLSREQFEAAGANVLVYGEQAGVYLAVSDDQFRSVYFQGHPEYDRNSLLKEYKREVMRFATGVRSDFPPYPEHYLPTHAKRLVEEFRDRLASDDTAEFPENELLEAVDNTWTDTGKALINNWLGLVYQLTHHDRRKPFMNGVDPRDPLGIRDDLERAATGS